MKSYLSFFTIILSLCFTQSIVFCQSNNFDWADASFEIGSIRKVTLYTDFQGPCSIKPCYDFYNNFSVYDTIINFLKVNPNIKIEIGVHADTRGEEGFNQKLTNRKASGIYGVLLEKGVLSRQLKCIGYGETMPIDTLIQKLNNRIEVKIVQNQRPPFIDAIQKNAAVRPFYNKEQNIFKIEKDTIENEGLKQVTILLQEILKDTTYAVEIKWHTDVRGSSRYSTILPDKGKDIKTYMSNNYQFDNNSFVELSCVIDTKVSTKFVFIKIISKSEYRQCIKNKSTFRITDKCSICPF